MHRKKTRGVGKRMSQSAFSETVYAVVQGIPPGQTRSYGEVAAAAGHPGAARAVGTLMKHNQRKDVPCHRVIRGDGSIGEYAFGGTSEKIRRLQQEGVYIVRGRRVFPT